MKFYSKSAALRTAISAIMAAGFVQAQAQTQTSAETHANDIVDEIIVTTTIQRTAAETALPVNILAGELLRERVAATLGETLDELVGIHSSSFGTGVGLPVIRGQSGNRVQVLQGGVSNIDASAVSPDHANSVEAALAERIEVLRGPATLLYGNGAIGGVVNVIDNRIPRTVPEAVTGFLETRHNTVSDQQMNVFKLDAGSGQFAWHVDGVYRESNNTRIPGFAINPDTIDFSDPEELEELLDSKGRITDSNTRSRAGTVGGSWIFEGGYLGASVNSLRNNYGVPAGAHEEHHEDDEDDHADDDHDDHGDEGGLRIDMKQDRIDVDGLMPLAGFFESVQGRLSFVDYQHAEIEGDGSIGTRYKNKGHEGRFSFAHQPLGPMQGVLGLQFNNMEFSAEGEEAYISPTDISSVALFTVQTIERDNMIYEFGLRTERQRFDQAGGRCDQSENSVSGSASSIWRFRENTNFLFSVAHSQRTPTVEELYSNIDNLSCAEPEDEHDLIAHFATNRLEIGDPNASKERSSNIEFGWRQHRGSVTGELNVFYNNIRDYLFLEDTGEFEDDIEIARITQQDALFRGVEAQVSMPMWSGDLGRTELTLFGDYVRARFDRGGNVPRIPAARFGAELSHSHADWVYRLRATRVGEQDKTARNESPTDGYTLLNIVVDYHAQVFGQELLLFAKGNNLLNEKIRNHTSRLKDLAPQAGRGYELGLRLQF